MHSPATSEGEREQIHEAARTDADEDLEAHARIVLGELSGTFIDEDDRVVV